jgi:uncharacterized membrane protein YbaN (DUF454 family)
MTRIVLYITGWLSLILGAIGLILPLIPGAPLLLVAAWCFSRSSESMHARIRRMPLVGDYLDDMEAGRGLAPEIKLVSVAALMAWIVIAAGIVLKEGLLRILIVVMGLGAILQILLMPTAERRIHLRTPSRLMGRIADRASQTFRVFR